MDEEQFDRLARILASATSRRQVLRGVLGGIAGGLGLSGFQRAGAVTCRDDGVLCAKDAQCCSGSCDANSHRCVAVSSGGASSLSYSPASGSTFGQLVSQSSRDARYKSLLNYLRQHGFTAQGGRTAYTVTDAGTLLRDVLVTKYANNGTGETAAAGYGIEADGTAWFGAIIGVGNNPSYALIVDSSGTVQQVFPSQGAVIPAVSAIHALPNAIVAAQGSQYPNCDSCNSGCSWGIDLGCFVAGLLVGALVAGVVGGIAGGLALTVACHIANEGGVCTTSCYAVGICPPTCEGDEYCPGAQQCCTDGAGNPQCVDTKNDPKNCGDCGLECNPQNMANMEAGSIQCNGGTCDGVCIDGFADCNHDKRFDGCETQLGTVDNCTGCGDKCDDDNLCTADTCDPANGCQHAPVADGTACTTADGKTGTCSNGQCGNACPSGQMSCSGTCIDTTSDPKNCGGCGDTSTGAHICPSGQTCMNGQCVSVSCQNGQSLCNGQCIDLNTDPNNCGSCGTICPNGVCGAIPLYGVTCCYWYQNAACPDPNAQPGSPPFCTNTTNDPKNCGSCGNVCDSGICLNGQCCGGTNPAVCSGQCADLDVDSNNCSSCGNVCPSGGQCVNGACQAAAGANPAVAPAGTPGT